MDKNRSDDFSRIPVFELKDDLVDYRLEHDPRFLARVERARTAFQAG
jgi:hypothetical protein